MRLPVRIFGLLLGATGLLLSRTAMAAPLMPDATPDSAFQQLLAEPHAHIVDGCAKPEDRLQKIICSGTLRVGVRGNYPLFGAVDGTVRTGYEIAIARRIAQQLGVGLSFVTVSPANRIALLAEDRIDLTIATMGHTTLRDTQARFIRPHYYASRTILVGPRAIDVPDVAHLAGRTVCVTVGNSSNAELSEHGARLLLFDSPEQLVDRLQAEACSLIAQDDSFFARAFADAGFRSHFEEKFAFAPLPWGMAVPEVGGERLATALALLSQIMHRDGVFLDVARASHISTAFLEEQRAVWARPECNRVGGFSDPACILPPLATDLAPTSFADNVTALENWLATHFDVHPTLAIFKIAPAWELVRNGVENSLILIVGTLLATFGFALLFGAALGSRRASMRIPARVVVMVLQSSPVVLSLVIAAAVANAMFAFSSTLALVASMLALGLTNGGNAGQAISEAMASLHTERVALRQGSSLFVHALRRSITQISAFLINATKGTPVASFVGAPELLNALTDSTSFSSDRATTYWLLLIFYVLAVLVVVRLCTALRHVLERRVGA